MPFFLGFTPGKHWSVYCLHSLVLFRMSYSWNHRVCSLLRSQYFFYWSFHGLYLWVKCIKISPSSMSSGFCEMCKVYVWIDLFLHLESNCYIYGREIVFSLFYCLSSFAKNNWLYLERYAYELCILFHWSICIFFANNTLSWLPEIYLVRW